MVVRKRGLISKPSWGMQSGIIAGSSVGNCAGLKNFISRLKFFQPVPIVAKSRFMRHITDLRTFGNALSENRTEPEGSAPSPRHNRQCLVNPKTADFGRPGLHRLRENSFGR